MAVGANIVQVKNIGEAHLSHADFKAPHRHFARQRKLTSVLVRHLIRQAHNLMNLSTSQIRADTESRVAHNVDVCFARQTQRLRNAASAGIFKVHNQVSVVARVGEQLITEI